MNDEPNGGGAGNGALSLPAKASINLKINGADKQIEAAPWTTLLDLLREYLDLTGTKKGCDHGQCGACTVLVDGRRINSCMTLAIMKDGAEVLTIEGLAAGDALHPADTDIDTAMSGNICRCGAYPNIVAAIEQAMQSNVRRAK